METVSRNVRLPVGREAPAFHHFSADAFPYSTRALHCSNTLTISTTQTPPAGNWPSRDPHKKEVLAMSSTLRVGQAAQVLGRSERSMHHLAWPTTAAGKIGEARAVSTRCPPHRPRQQKKKKKREKGHRYGGKKNGKKRIEICYTRMRNALVNSTHTTNVDITQIQTSDGNPW